MTDFTFRDLREKLPMVMLNGRRCPGCNNKIKTGEGHQYQIKQWRSKVLICSDCVKDSKEALYDDIYSLGRESALHVAKKTAITIC